MSALPSETTVRNSHSSSLESENAHSDHLPNIGEIVDAACVNTAADRQVTPSTSATGADILIVQRSFSAGFRPDLVGKQACVGFNGKVFLAQDCNAAGIKFVSLVGGVLKSGAACQSGHDDKAQLTVDVSGANCASVTTTTVSPAAV